MTIDLVRTAARQFLPANAVPDIQPLGNGLIHHTYRVSADGSTSIVLQAINTHVFKSPGSIVHNYEIIFDFLGQKNIVIPEPQKSIKGNLLWIDESGNHWRANRFINHSFTPEKVTGKDAAYTVALVFGQFTKALEGLDISTLKAIIPGFHNLTERYNRFEESLTRASIERLLQSTHIIAELRERKNWVAYFELLSKREGFPLRVLHHDCKVSNILFDEQTGAVICPVDLDTVMPGLFFSDIGDMIRSIAATVDENSTAWEEIGIDPLYYNALIGGYMDSMGDSLTAQEKNDIHYSGLLIIYMQTLRFLTDFLEGDPYYKINYPGQNLNRALNQLLLLQQLESFLESGYRFRP